MRVGFTSGCFDTLHEGHRYLLRFASVQCHLLIVAVADDMYCRKHKGPNRPIDNLPTRIARIRAYGEQRGHHCTWSIVPFDGFDNLLASIIRPDVVIRGWDQSETCGTIPVIQVDKHPGFSTTLLALKRSKPWADESKQIG